MENGIEMDSSSPSPRFVSELAYVNNLLAADQNAFNGFNKTSNLAEIRAESDRMRQAWMDKEMMAAKDAQRALLAGQHEANWKRLEANRAKRGNAQLAANIVHGLMMIYNNKKKAGL